jgi:hypothetical protein
MRDLIRRILREETSDRFGPLIKKLLGKKMPAAYVDQICDIQVEKFSYEWGDTYNVKVIFDIGSGIDQVDHESMLWEIYDLMYTYFSVSANVGLEFTRGCKEGINEQSEDKLVPLIRRLLRKRIIETYSDEVCDIKVNVFNTRSVDYKRYWIDLIFDGNNLSSIYSIKNIMDETSNLVKGYFNIQPFMNSQIVNGCEEEQSKEEQNEGLHDTSWENDEGDKITLIDLLDATEDIPVKKIFLNKIKSKLITWDGDDKEIAKIEKADLRYPILILVDDNNKFISIIDGHHRAHKALRNGLKKINAKIIPINSLPKNIRKVFKGMGKQEEMTETEITERCWKGYTQKGMKTMFGKRYPNCVKKNK